MPDPHQPKTFAVADPRTFDGDPYEVAERAVKQLAGVLAVAEDLFDATDKMARNAQMQRDIDGGDEPMGSDWPNTPLGRRLGQVGAQISTTKETLTKLSVASGYNPKRPPKE